MGARFVRPKEGTMAVITGTNQGDLIDGTDGDDVIQAGQNKDAPDVVNAGAGDDVVYGKSFDPDNAGNPTPDAANPTDKEIVDSTQNGSIEDNAPDFFGNEVYGDDGDDIIVGERMTTFFTETVHPTTKARLLSMPRTRSMRPMHRTAMNPWYFLPLPLRARLQA